MAKKKWIKGAIKREGAFKEKAEEEGMTVREYAAKVTKKGSKASPLTKKQAQLAKTLMNFKNRHKKGGS